MKITPGQYVDVTFTPDQKRARSIWKKAGTLKVALADGLFVSADTPQSRQEWHAYLDRRLDAIERLRHDAAELFPDVDKSFTISTWELGK